jgi:hypothetical protein
MKRKWLKVAIIAIFAAFMAIACARGCDECRNLTKDEIALAKAFGVTECDCGKKL